MSIDITSSAGLAAVSRISDALSHAEFRLFYMLCSGPSGDHFSCSLERLRLPDGPFTDQEIVEAVREIRGRFLHMDLRLTDSGVEWRPL